LLLALSGGCAQPVSDPIRRNGLAPRERSFCRVLSSKRVEGDFDTEFKKRTSINTEWPFSRIDSVPIRDYANGQ